MKADLYTRFYLWLASHRRVVAADPVGMSGLVVAKVLPLQTGFNDAQLVDGHITSSDGRHVLLMAEPKLPSSNSGASAALVDEMLRFAGEVEKHFPGVHVCLELRCLSPWPSLVISSRIDLEEDVLAILPHHDQIVSEYQYAIRKFRQIDRVYFDVGINSSDPDKLNQAADELYARLATNQVPLRAGIG